LVDVVIQKLTNIVQEKQRIDFVHLHGLRRERLIFADVNQSEVLCHPLHKVFMFFGDSFELGRVSGQRRAPNDQATQDFLENVRFRPVSHLSYGFLGFACVKGLVKWWRFNARIRVLVLLLSCHNASYDIIQVKILIDIS